MKRNYIGIIKILIVFCSILVSSSVVNALNSTYSLTDSQQMYVSGSDLVSVEPPVVANYTQFLNFDGSGGQASTPDRRAMMSMGMAQMALELTPI